MLQQTNSKLHSMTEMKKECCIKAIVSLRISQPWDWKCHLRILVMCPGYIFLGKHLLCVNISNLKSIVNCSHILGFNV